MERSEDRFDLLENIMIRWTVLYIYKWHTITGIFDGLKQMYTYRCLRISINVFEGIKKRRSQDLNIYGHKLRQKYNVKDTESELWNLHPLPTSCTQSKVHQIDRNIMNKILNQNCETFTPSPPPAHNQKSIK